ncbi:helix-turn-helix domain-containing protein [Quadrisphaera oryzae]|uniref:helix-turn-helix domain-containing protein n=1 Tax=Quadrisphaera TaxID=317661 RepID=UPI001649478F|nr:helix-turn-helix domain-containing protein [Quadrisphaera sp. RL12-1S]MBC3763432.1 helix-turn-helix domain-containing protein [Quadrisphaera sp. RL12-1S]
MTDRSTEPAPPNEPAVDALVVEDQLFSIVPEWVIEADISDPAFRLYALLLRYGNGSGVRMPSRATLAERLHRSTDAVDRALRNLEEKGLVVIERRRRGGVNLSNLYYLRTARPAAVDGPDGEGGSRSSAATPPSTSGDQATPPRQNPPVTAGGGRTSAATGRETAAGVAADLRPDPEISTQRSSPPPPPSPAPSASQRAAREEEVEFLHSLNIDPQGGLDVIVEMCAASRTAHGLGTACWQAPHLLAALELAVRRRLWPARFAATALLKVAADPATRSPMRLAEAGPWWDEASKPEHASGLSAEDVDALEARLQALDGGRMALQQQARAELTQESMPLTRTTVLRRACEILDRRAAS